jgi:hypothetical protein
MLVAAGRCRPGSAGAQREEIGRPAYAITLASPPSPLTAHLATLIQDALGPDYRIEQELDGGGMSRLFVATDLRHSRRVVVKVLSPELVTDTSTARFKREIELTVRLQHPHILPILTSGARDDTLYYITPFIPGESLKARIEREGKLPLDDIIKILRDASGALAFAHARGVVHRDVKPGNILLAEGHAILADFGIARAVSTQTSQLTVTGMMPGTPAYMAPELPTEEAGDVYALGVVAYEMLVGTLPRRGVTAKEIVAARGAVEGDDRRRLTACVALVENAISGRPAERIASIQQFCTRLDEPSRRVLAPRSWAFGGVLLAAVAVIVAGATTRARAREKVLNPDRYVVLAIGAATGETVVSASRLESALSEWRGVSLADPARVGDVAASGTIDHRRALSVARQLGARNLVTLETLKDGDSLIVSASVYDAAADTVAKLRRVGVLAKAAQADRQTAYRRLANAVVRNGDDLPWRDPASAFAPSVVAWRAYDEGRDAIRHWDLAAADKALRAAVAADPQMAQAHLWLARTLIWRGPRTIVEEARTESRRASDLRARLAPRDSQHAVALLALANGDPVGASEVFRRLIAADSSDLAGWLGLADCLAKDNTVISSSRSATGKVFRSSWESAADVYRRASEVGSITEGPFQGWVLGRVSSLLFPTTNRVRLGRGLGPDTTNYVSLPFLDHDTLAFAPYPMRDVASGTYEPPARLVQAAAARARQSLRQAAEEWVRRSPQSAAALDSLAGWMEVSGGVGSVNGRQMTALDVVRRACEMSNDSMQRTRLRVAEVRLLVKDGKFPDARALADSLLRGGAANHAADVPGVNGLAVLLGRVEQAAQLTTVFMRQDPRLLLAGGQIAILPPQLADAAARLLTYSSLGVDSDSVDAQAKTASGLIESYFPDSAMAASVRAGILPASLAYVFPRGRDYLRNSMTNQNLNTGAYQSLARGDTVAARAQLVRLRRMGEGKEAGGAVDQNFLRARLALILGDTASALRELDPVLRALPTLGQSLLSEIPQVASLIRSLALRAQVAHRLSDRATAQRCARAVIALWKDADTPLQPLVREMTSLAGAT